MDGYENGYQNDMCSRESGLRAPNMIIILGSRVDISGGGYTTAYAVMATPPPLYSVLLGMAHTPST